MAHRCPDCHNEYPSWSPGYCPTCALRERDNKRYRTRHKSAQQKFGRMILEPEKRTTTKPKSEPKPKPTNAIQRKRQPVQKAINIDKQNYRKISSIKEQNLKQLDAFHQLFKDIYGRKIFFSHMLLAKGVSEPEIKQFKRDHDSVHLFLKKFIKKLHNHLDENNGYSLYSIINLYYGLDGSGEMTEKAIAIKFAVPLHAVIRDREKVLIHFKTEVGSERLREIIYLAYKDISREIR